MKTVDDMRKWLEGKDGSAPIQLTTSGLLTDITCVIDLTKQKNGRLVLIGRGLECPKENQAIAYFYDTLAIPLIWTAVLCAIILMSTCTWFVVGKLIGACK